MKYTRNRQMTLSELIIYTVLGVSAVVGLGSIIGSCQSDNSEAVRALDTNGFSNVTIHDSGFWGSFHGCDKHDGAWYSASATNPVGKTVELVVCCGGPASFKGCTVRSK